MMCQILIMLSFSSCGARNTASTSADGIIASQIAIQPQNEVEKVVLAKVPTVQAGTQINVGKYSFVVTNEYFAASGHECKSIEFLSGEHSSPSHLKTVCEFDGKWGYTQEVLAPSLNE